jgi:hypothetical protein
VILLYRQSGVLFNSFYEGTLNGTSAIAPERAHERWHYFWNWYDVDSIIIEVDFILVIVLIIVAVIIILLPLSNSWIA